MAEQQVEQHISEAAVQELRKRIGVEWKVTTAFNDVATKDAIRHFAYGIGDVNPLFYDEDYARKTRYGTIIAPPGFVFSCRGVNAFGLPGVHGMFSGVRLEFHKPLKMNDQLIGMSSLYDLVEKRSQFAQRMIQQFIQVRYLNQNGEMFCRALYHAMRTERDTARERGKYATIQKQRYTPEQITPIDELYEREEIRGSRPRYWEDTNPGEEITPVVKGPITVTDIIGFLMGCGSPFVRPHRIAYEYRKRHPKAYIPNSLGVPDVPERVHWEDEFAQKVGVPAAYDYGVQRVSWMGNLMTNWTGDDGTLKVLDIEVRRFVIIGDTVVCKGKVVRKWVENGEHLVECDVWGENQRGEATTSGKAVVALPSRQR